MKVKDIMTSDSLKYCGPETKLHEAAKVMRTGNCGTLPVLNAKKQVVGIITDRDICLSIGKDKGLSAIEANVGAVMSPQVHTVLESDDVNIALGKMRANRVGRLPVIDQDGQLKGILSMHDLLAESIENGKPDLSQKSVPGENIFKTIRALSDRYIHRSTSASKNETAKSSS